MPRRKSMSSIDAEISALKDKISATKTRYENLCRANASPICITSLVSRQCTEAPRQSFGTASASA